MKLRSLLSLTLLFCLLLPCAHAVVKDDPDGLAVHFNMKTLDEWVFVTPDNYLEHMDLCLSRGCTAADVHERFQSGRIVWEGYYTKLPEGIIRYEKWSDPYTRNVWSMEAINAKERKALLTEIENIWSDGRYTYYKTFIKSTKNSSNNVHGISYSFNSNPPLCYESGLGMLTVQNGVAMSVSYVQFTSRASAAGYLKNDNTYASMSRVYFYDHTPKYTSLVRQTECVDLLPGDEWIVNAHTGMDIPISGVTESGAQVTVSAENQIFTAKVDKEGRFSTAIHLESEGEIEASCLASKAKLQDNSLSQQISVHNNAAALILTHYPTGNISHDEPLTVEGLAHDHAQITLQLSGQEAVTVPVSNGAFSYTFTADPWRLHELTITAKEEGKADAVAVLPVFVQYDNIEQGVREFKKAASTLNCRQLAADPAAHVGELVRMEFYTTGMQHTDLGLAFEANGLYDNKKYPMILLSDGYLNDVIVDGMYITAYGIVSDPTLTDEPMPRIQLVYVTYQKKNYK